MNLLSGWYGDVPNITVIQGSSTPNLSLGFGLGALRSFLKLTINYLTGRRMGIEGRKTVKNPPLQKTLQGKIQKYKSMLRKLEIKI